MSISTSMAKTPQLYNTATSSEAQWNPDTRHLNSQNQTVFLPEQPQVPYRHHTVNCNGSTGIYGVPKIPNNNLNCDNGHIHFNPPSYMSSVPNGLINQDVRFQRVYNGVHNSAVVIPNPRNGHYAQGVNTWVGSVDNRLTRPVWTPSKPVGGVKKQKRIRTAFTSQQMMELENEYARTRYLDRSRRIELSELLNLNERTIKIWFQNRRMKEKKDRSESLEETEATSTTDSSPETGPMILYDSYPQSTIGGGFDRVNYVEQFQPPVSSAVQMHSALPTLAASQSLNTYPTFVLDNSIQLPEQMQLFNNSNVQCEVQEVNIQIPEYHHNVKDEMLDFKEDVIENSSLQSEGSSKDATKDDVNGQNWDLSWIRSIHIDEEVQE